MDGDATDRTDPADAAHTLEHAGRHLPAMQQSRPASGKCSVDVLLPHRSHVLAASSIETSSLNHDPLMVDALEHRGQGHSCYPWFKTVRQSRGHTRTKIMAHTIIVFLRRGTPTRAPYGHRLKPPVSRRTHDKNPKRHKMNRYHR